MVFFRVLPWLLRRCCKIHAVLQCHASGGVQLMRGKHRIVTTATSAEYRPGRVFEVSGEYFNGNAHDLPEDLVPVVIVDDGDVGPVGLG